MGALQLVLGLICLAVTAVAVVMVVRTVRRMISSIRLGQPDPTRRGPFGARFGNMVKEILGHTKMLKFGHVGVAHWFVMVGFGGLSLSVLEAYFEVFVPTFETPLLSWFGPWNLIVELLGITTVLGGFWLIGVRQLNHPRRADRVSRFEGSNFGQAYFVEAVVVLEGFGIMGLRAFKQASGLFEAPFWSSPLTYALGGILPSSTAAISIFAGFKILSAMIWVIVIASNITMGVAWHRFTAFFNIYFKREAGDGRALGALQPMMSGGKELDFEEADPDEDVFGVGKVEDFKWKGWLDFTTCTECGRCQSQCPAWNTAKPLSPKLLITSLRDHAYAKAPYLLAGGSKDMAGDEVGITGEGAEEKLAGINALALAEAERPLVGGPDEMGVIDPEVLWACTSCGACVEQCPVDIEHVDHIVDMRRYQVLIESNFPTELGGMFKNLENKGNPWGQNAKDRLNWTEDLDFEVPVFDGELEDDTEYVFWVGCAGAFEDRAKKTTRAVAELLHMAGVKYTVLGGEETCTGDPARRAGNEFLFQMLAQQNVEVLNSVFEGREPGKRKIVATCAHCFNSLANEYSQLGGNFEVVHHTQLLNKLVREKRLVPVAPIAEDVTYHDPCYLGRHNKVYTPPRDLVGASGANFREMPRHGDRSMCCGAGGARMWMEEKTGKRINVERVDEALGTAPQKIATGCPFCRVMLNDGLTARQNEGAASESVEIIDVAQLLLSSVKRGGDGASAPVADGSAETGGAETGGEAEANGKADVPTDAEPTGTPLPDQDKSEN
ncbi:MULTISPECIES: (Fe-S)-binding protein [unclassified Saccharopolyspora]|uniref:(Fe-S)-binding protein n=1 Tax=unclassified Saccharopolyspora TaxID=2646250 RepID=UPI001CD2294D|nr:MULTISPECIES: (Fe-S)-binding protein [unclassified Saccharopolyspora]MCA1188384.1 (Fe-S)-binding protein [Saccharopolyspora sp. 6T]MCA1194794.1 (Fe-S)-binding protein [Saccharopolyspora sp. 6V]MCA1228246.1 (Fe-S)-binding protein [Saccharopolyspora sp. 6M]MCA1281304.1 (Fe-S)-binding protein [Saccharopolyspora sp. 7B]